MEIYGQYQKLTGRKQAKFYEQHISEITSCQAAKRYFDSLGLKKLPSIQSLKQEYAILQAENKKAGVDNDFSSPLRVTANAEGGLKKPGATAPGFTGVGDGRPPTSECRVYTSALPLPND